MLDRDFLLVHATAGTIGGVAGVYVGAPLDTVKVLLQSGRGNYSGVWDCVRRTVGSQGPRALYKGALTSALGQIPNNAVVFGCYGSTLAWLARTFPTEASSSGGSSNPFIGGQWNVFWAGCWAGLLQSLVLAPFEHIKCQQQVADWRPGVKHMSMLDCARGLVAAKGVGGLYRGLWSLVCRDCPTYGLYFVAYEMVKDRLIPPGSGGEAPMYAMLLAGGVAGMAAWAAATPFDVIKSVIQGSPIGTPARENAIVAVASRLYKAEGVRGFFRGLSSSLLRAFPVNAATFLVYESLLGLAPEHRHPNEEAPRK